MNEGRRGGDMEIERRGHHSDISWSEPRLIMSSASSEAATVVLPSVAEGGTLSVMEMPLEVDALERLKGWAPIE
jgi:hypothetical protein